MAKHIEIPSSITSCEFYKKGHTHKDGMNVVDNEQLFCLEKYRQIPICRAADLWFTSQNYTIWGENLSCGDIIDGCLNCQILFDTGDFPVGVGIVST